MGLIRVVPAKGPTGPLYLSNSLTLTTKKADAIYVQFLRSDEPHGIGLIVCGVEFVWREPERLYS